MKKSLATKQRELAYAKARLIKFNELQKKYQPEFEKAQKAQNADWLDKINNKIKEELVEFSQEYWEKK